MAIDRAVVIRDMVKQGVTFTAAFLVRDALVALTQMILSSFIGLGGVVRGAVTASPAASVSNLLPWTKLTELVSHVATAGIFLAIAYAIADDLFSSAEDRTDDRTDNRGSDRG